MLPRPSSEPLTQAESELLLRQSAFEAEAPLVIGDILTAARGGRLEEAFRLAQSLRITYGQVFYDATEYPRARSLMLESWKELQELVATTHTLYTKLYNLLVIQ